MGLTSGQAGGHRRRVGSIAVLASRAPTCHERIPSQKRSVPDSRALGTEPPVYARLYVLRRHGDGKVAHLGCIAVLGLIRVERRA
jgi:hypothetical protein